MKKRILSILLALCMVLCLVPTGVFAEDTAAPKNADITGSGTQDDPYLIYTAEGLKAFRDKANGGERNAFATLMNDIILNDGTFDEDGNYTSADGGTSEPEKWTPIGTGNNQYRGTFDGNGKTIKGLYVNTENDEPAGLFGSTTSPKIKNLTVDGSVTGKRYVGGILGFSIGGVIENCTNNASVTAADIDNDPYAFVYIGGIAGCCTSKLTGCVNTGKVIARNISQGANVGGVVGYQNNPSMYAIYDCYNTGDVSGEAGKLYLGGISGGIIMGSISECFSVGTLDSTGSTTVYLGGIVGLNSSTLTLTNDYYLEGTAENAVGKEETGDMDANTVKPMSKEAFGDGTILNLMINGRADGTHPWGGACGYIESIDMVLPILKRQNDIYGHSHCICGGSTDVGDHTAHNDTDWTPWTSTDSLPDKAGSYYLMNNVTLTYDLDRGGFWSAKENINICLNGKTISSNAYALRIGSSATLSVTDCGNSGKIIGGNIYTGQWTSVISSVVCDSGSVFNLYGGALLMNEEGKGMGNKIVVMYTDINFNGAEFNMYGGSIGESSHIGTEDECRYLEAKRDNRFNAYGGAIYGPVYFGFRAKVNFGNTAFAVDVRHRKDYSSDFLGTEPTNFIGDARMVWEYPFHILVGDTQIRIDDRNKNDILGDGSGSLKYEFDENSQIDSDGNFNEEKGHGTLTFNNAKLVYDADSNCDVINFGKYFSLDIVLNGKNAIVPDEGEEKGSWVITGREKLTIKGDGSLDIVSKRDQCIGASSGVALGDENIMILTSTNSDGTGAVKTAVGDGGALSAAKYLRIGANHTHCICGKNTNSSHSHTDVVWTPWASSDSLPSTEGNYYLVDNVTLPTGDITMPDGVNICLNGNSIRSTDADNTKLKINGALCITDCETTGNLASITQVSGKLVVWDTEIKSGIFSGEVVNNGKITGGIFYGTVTGSGIIEDSAKRTVTFDPNGGSTVDSQKILRGQKAAEPTGCKKIGYTLTAWKNGENKYDFAKPVLDDITLTAQWKDTEKPTGEIIISENKWSGFLNKITFGLFFKETQKVTINASDNGGKVSIGYYVTQQDLTESQLSSVVFYDYSDSFNIEQNGKYIVYVMLVDESLNITYLRSDGITIDKVAPVIGGIEDGKIYCEAQTVTIDEEHIGSVTVNGKKVTPDENNKFVLTPPGEQKIIITDKAGNTAEMTVTVNNGHTALADDNDCTTPVYCKFCNAEVVAAKSHDFTGAWHNDDSGHWHECQNENCNATDAVIAHSGTDDGDCTTALVCECGYIITAAKSEHTFGEWTSNGDDTHTRKCTVDGCTKGIENENCRGGEATCTKKAVCEICGKTYGELDANNHTDLEHNDARTATEDNEGNIEYWHCDDCGKNFSDKDGANEITAADIVIEKLPKEKEPPYTGENSNIMLWITLLFVSGATVITTTVIGKKKHSDK